MLYLVCHGTHRQGRPYLWLEREDGTADRVAGEALARAVADLPRWPVLVVLAACQSAGRTHDAGVLAAVGPQLAAAGVGAVVAMQADVTQATAGALLPAFFAELRRDGDIDRALAAARAAVARDRPDWWVPALFLRLRDGRLWAADAGGPGVAAGPSPAAAQRLLQALPVEAVPPPAPALPPGSRVALRPNSLFVGREAERRAVAAALQAGQPVAVTGLGGVGKTQLAVEAVHRYGPHFAGGVFWLSCADPAGVPAEVAACGGAGHLALRPDFGGLPLDEQVALVQAAWRDGPPRLLVFDNCEAPGLLAQWRPPSGACRVLVTARRAAWGAALGVQPVPLDSLGRPESVALLRGHRPDLPVGDAALDAVAAELGDLPLALHLAGAFLAQHRDAVAPAAYLAQLRRPDLLTGRWLRLADGADPSPTGHVPDVARTFALSYDQLRPAEPTDALALALLARAACFAPGEPIPRELLVGALGLAADDADAQLDADEALTRAVGLGLLEREARGALRLHRLLARFVAHLGPDPTAQSAVEAVLRQEAARVNRTGYIAPLLPLQPHLRAVTERALSRGEPAAAELANEVGYHLYLAADYEGARPYYERALAVYERALGPDHPATARSLSNLGMLLRAQGDYEGARPHLEGALATRERALGPDHPATATALNNLAGVLRAQGDPAAARPYLERALAITERALGPDHPATAASLNDLGALLQAQGDYEGARPCYERALRIHVATLGEDHPATAALREIVASLSG